MSSTSTMPDDVFAQIDALGKQAKQAEATAAKHAAIAEQAKTVLSGLDAKLTELGYESWEDAEAGLAALEAEAKAAYAKAQSILNGDTVD